MLIHHTHRRCQLLLTIRTTTTTSKSKLLLRSQGGVRQQQQQQHLFYPIQQPLVSSSRRCWFSSYSPTTEAPSSYSGGGISQQQGVNGLQQHQQQQRAPPAPPPPQQQQQQQRQQQQQLRAYPTYTVYGESSFLSLKILLPVIRVGRNNVVSVDSSKKGRLLLEWVPRPPPNDGTSPQRDTYTPVPSIRFGLSAEEVGLVLDKFSGASSGMDDKPVVFTRRPPPSSLVDSMMPDKVLRISRMVADRGETIVQFYIDYERDGIGSQQPPIPPTPANQDPTTAQQQQPQIVGPLYVNVPAGELQVICEIMRSSIPCLCGWSTMMEIAKQRLVDDAVRIGGGGGGGSYSPGGGGGGGYNVPF